jgi:hypothetical protein
MQQVWAAPVIPLALSSAGWTAIGAVGGALVGATAGGLVDWLLGLRRERSAAKAGARLVAGDIASAESQIAVAEKSGEWLGFYGHPIASWSNYRDVLAVKLSSEDFEAVSQAVMVLEGIRQKLPDSPRGAREIAEKGFISLDDPATLTPIRHEAAKAYNALAELAGHEPEGDLIQRPTD